MTADYAALEARVAELEQQIRHILPVKIDAMNFGISVLHDEARAFREETGARFDRLEAKLGGVDNRLGHLESKFDSQDRRLDAHGEMLQEILRRLPG
jgi:uncharacterized coiled-coil protein SlyX